MAHIHDLYDFTVSFYIIHPDKDKICLHYHLKLKCWNQLGGHIELDEQPLESIERELREEAGLEPNDYSILPNANEPEFHNVRTVPTPFKVLLYNYGGDSSHQHIDLPYVIQSHTDRLVPAENESQRIDWFTLEQMNKMVDSGSLDKGTREICEWALNQAVKQ